MACCPSPGGRTIVVGGFSASVSRDTLQYYLENTRRSGGGDVQEILIDRERAVAHVTFVDPGVAERVCSRSHSLQSCCLLISFTSKIEKHEPDRQTAPSTDYSQSGRMCNRFENDFRSGSGENMHGTAMINGAYPDSHAPEAAQMSDQGLHEPLQKVVINGLSQNKLRFFLQDSNRRRPLEQQLEETHIQVEWPSDESERSLVLKYGSSERIHFQWSEMAKQKLEKCFDTIHVKEFTIMTDIWHRVLEELKKLVLPKADHVDVYLNSSISSVVIVGYLNVAKSIAEKVEKTILEVENNFMFERETVKDICSHLKKNQLKILSVIDYSKKMADRYRGLRVIINMASLEVIFEGQSVDVTLAKKDMDRILSDITEQHISPKLYQIQTDFMSRREIGDYISEKLNRGGLLGIWDVIGQDVVVYQMSTTKCRQAADTILKSIVRVLIPVDDDGKRVLASRTWDAKVAEIERHFGSFVKIETNRQYEGLCLVCTDDISYEVENIIKNFFCKNVSEIKRIDVDNCVIKFLQMHCGTDLVKLSSVLKQNSVMLEHDENCFTLKGTRDALRIGEQKVQDLIGRVCHRRHLLKNPAITKYIHSAKGRDYLFAVEHANACLINLDAPELTARQKQIQETCITATGQKISVVLGNITELQADAIVNAANEQLQHAGGLARKVVDKGGESIQRECDDFIRQHGPLFNGEIYCSTPGSLRCRTIIHAVGPIWSKGDDKEKFCLNAVTLKCLTECTRRNLKSIAIPALSAGIFGFPRKIATSIIVESVKQFLEADQNRILDEVMLCDTDAGVIQDFTDALRESYRGQGARIDSKNDGSDPPASGRPAAPFGSLTVKIVRGELAKERADILVCTTSSNLKLNSGLLSKSVSEVGGRRLQDECNNKYPNGIRPGEIAVTGNGHLHCYKVYWGTLPAWDGGTGDSSKSLGNFLNNCLMEAEQSGMATIAIPALGTGKLGFPKDIVANVMFQTISDFAVRNPVNLKEVRLILYERDKSTIKAFEFEEQKWITGLRKTETKDTVDDHSDPVIGSGNTFIFGKIKLTVKQGDVSAESCDSIANGVTKEANFNKGAVSGMLLKKGGPTLQRECDSKKSDIIKNGVIATSGGNLPCKVVIHVILPTSGDRGAWQQVILKCLKKAEENRLTSLSFPAIGTGGLGLSVAKLALAVFEALMEFSTTSVMDLTDIRFVLFQPQMLPAFIAGISECFKRARHGIKGPANTSRPNSSNKSRDRSPRQSSDPTETEFMIYAMTQRSIEAAIRKIETMCSQETTEKVIQDELIKSLDQSQISKIERLSRDNQLKMNIDCGSGSIKFTGLVSDVMDAVHSVYDILREMEKLELKAREAQILADFVSWNYIDVTLGGQVMKAYQGEISIILENAYRDNKSQTTFQDTTGRSYTVDFASMEEYPVMDSTDRVKVVRKDLVKRQPATVTSVNVSVIPKTWSSMGEKVNVKVVLLVPSDPEYQEVEQSFLQCGGPPTVQKIERVQNQALYQQYTTKRKLMEQQNSHISQNERTLWHGTSEDATDSICLYGFNRSYCGKNATAYGQGVYFSSKASYSASPTYARVDSQGNKRLYRSRVLTGEYTKGKQGLRVPPQKNATTKLLFDCVVENTAAPSVFVIFNDTQAYPEYLITFK